MGSRGAKGSTDMSSSAVCMVHLVRFVARWRRLQAHMCRTRDLGAQCAAQHIRSSADFMGAQAGVLCVAHACGRSEQRRCMGASAALF